MRKKFHDGRECPEKEKCTIGCGCPDGLKNTGTHCIPPNNCDCYDMLDKKNHSHFRSSGSFDLVFGLTPFSPTNPFNKDEHDGEKRVINLYLR